MKKSNAVFVVFVAFALAFWLGRRTGGPESDSPPASPAATAQVPPGSKTVAPALRPDYQSGSRSKRARDFSGVVKDSNTKAYYPEDKVGLTIRDMPQRQIPIINVHEHAQHMADAERLLKWMDHYKIQKTCLQAASIYTFTLNNKWGFEKFDENNVELLNIKKRWADRFCAFVTIHPPDDGNLAKLEDYAKRGADGLKLYLGHGAGTGKGKFHMMPLDDPRMMPIYAWAERTQFPLMFHINFTKYFDEFVRVLEAHPHLRVCVPHFGLHKNTAKRLARLTWLFDRYPNFYVDMSYGHHSFHKQGFESLGKWRTRTQEFLRRHKDRILFATDMVLEKGKDEQFIEETLRSYIQWLEMSQFRFHMVPTRTMKGMDMGKAPEVLQAIYWDSPKKFLMLDDDNLGPDRSGAWPPAGVTLPGLPPNAPVVKPLGPSEQPPPGK